MHTVNQLFDAVKTVRAVQSDYALAGILGVTKAAINAVRKRGGSISDATAIKVAEITGLPAAYVVACAHAERAQIGAERDVWESIAKKAAGAAACLVLALFSAPPDGIAAGARAQGVQFIHYAKWLALKALRVLARTGRAALLRPVLMP